MLIIKHKIRQTKLGGKNPAAKKVKCKNEETKEEFHFNSLSEMQGFLKRKIITLLQEDVMEVQNACIKGFGILLMKRMNMKIKLQIKIAQELNRLL